MWHLSRNWWQLALVALANNLHPTLLQPGKKHFQGGPGHCTDFDPDYDTGDELLAHPLRRPLSGHSPEETVVVLGFDTPTANLFGKAICQGQYEQVFYSKEIDGPCCLTTPPSAI